MTPDSLQLLNRFALRPDGWVQVVPLGEFAHPGSGLVQVLDSLAVRRMAQDFDNRTRAGGFPGLLVDFDHESHDPAKSSQAAGWITHLENRSDGLWARIRWTDVGEQAVRNGRFRLCSPVFERASAEELGNGRVRPVRLLDVGLTNDPNLTTLPPITNRNPGGPTKADPIASPMKTVLLALGLSPDASEPAALEAVNVLKNRAGTAEQQAADFKNRSTTAEAELKTLRETTADADLLAFKDRLDAATEAFWRGNLIANRAETLKALEGLKKPGTSGDPADPTKRLLNRRAAGTPEGGAGEKDPGTALVQKVEAFRIANRCTADQAWAAIRVSNPEMFAAAAAPAGESAGT